MQRHIDANGVIKGRSAIVAGDGGVAYQQMGVVIAVAEVAFGSKIKDVCGVGPLVTGYMIPVSRREGLRTAEVKVSMGCVT